MPRNLFDAAGFTFGFWLALALLVPVTAPWAYTEDPELARMEGLLMRQVNAFRREHRLLEFQRRADLDAVARAHAEDMALRGYLAHRSPEGDDWVARLRSAGVEGFAMAGENIGRTNKPHPNREILQGWIHSPPHLENLMARPYNATGIGIARAPDGSLIYTQLYLSFPR